MCLQHLIPVGEIGHVPVNGAVLDIEDDNIIQENFFWNDDDDESMDSYNPPWPTFPTPAERKEIWLLSIWAIHHPAKEVFCTKRRSDWIQYEDGRIEYAEWSELLAVDEFDALVFHEDQEVLVYSADYFNHQQPFQVMDPPTTGFEY
jgi:hypothetical protein